jgi:hypothetical protein
MIGGSLFYDFARVGAIPHVPTEDLFLMWDKESVLEMLQPHVTEERYRQLDLKVRNTKLRRGKIDFLTEAEKQLVERLYMQSEADNVGGSSALAFYTVNGPRGTKLTFEAFIEDDGGCVHLKTPYDERDGTFTDLSKCLIEEDDR